jgi:nucleoside-diphosphate-sugar epimerase
LRALILGGAGFVGANLAAELSSKGHEPFIVDLPEAMDALSAPRHPSDEHRRNLLRLVPVFRGDVRRIDRLDEIFAETNPDLVYFLSALPLVGLVETQVSQASEIMIQGLINALEASRKAAGLRRFIYVSSSMVYGDFELDPVPEPAGKEPVNVYGLLKLAGEGLVRAYLRTTPVEFAIVRPSGVYGPGDPHGRVVQKFCAAALGEGELEVVNAEDTFVDFTWIGDLADGLVRVGTAPEAGGEIFNLTRGKARSLKELVSIIVKAAPDVAIVSRRKHDQLRPRRGALDIAKARALLEYDPATDLEAGVAMYLEHMRAQRAQAAQQRVVGA